MLTTKDHNKVSTMEAANINLRSLIASREWKHVMKKINSEPKSISQKQEIELCGQRTEAYPLHQVVSQRPPLNIVDAMVSVFPDACWLPDDVLGKLPLHIACQNRASGEVQRCLLIAFPDAAKLTDTVERRLPLHYACIDGYLNEVSLLIAAEKRALKAKDIHGKTPVDLCQASFSPHRDAILKRMYEIAKFEGNHSRPKEKPQRAQATEEPTQTQLPFESPSNITVNASNLTKDMSNGKAHGMLSPMKSGKSKSMLPAWARGRKASKSNIQPSPSRKRHSSVDTEKRSNVPKGAKKRGSSLERLRPRRNSFKSDNLPLVDILDPVEKDGRPAETRSLPPNTIEPRSPAVLSSHSSTTSGKKSRKKKTMPRNREDSVPELPPNVANQSFVPVNESVEHEEPLTDLSAPEVARRKKKGLAQNSDLMKILDQEEREALNRGGCDAKILALPSDRKRSPMKRSNIPLSARVRQNGNRSLSVPRQETERISKRSNDTERASYSESEKHQSMPTILSASPMIVKRSVESSSALVVNEGNYASMGKPENVAKHRHLHLRKAALIEECTHANDALIKKRAQAQISKREIDLLESRMRELQIALDKQRAELDMTLSGIRMHEEILADHYGKIKAVDRELAALATSEPPRSCSPSPEGRKQPAMRRPSPKSEPMTRDMTRVSSASKSSSSTSGSSSNSLSGTSSGTGTSSSTSGSSSSSSTTSCSRPASPSWVRWQKDKMMRESQQG